MTPEMIGMMLLALLVAGSVSVIAEMHGGKSDV
jgi:hypothetical protein